MNRFKTFTCFLAYLLITSCSKETMPNQTLAKHVNLDRFMGKWYVHGHTPTFMDKQAFNATEAYKLETDGTIRTTYQYNKDSLDGKLKTYKPVGKVYDSETNAEWRMKFFGIFNAPYYILYVDSDYKFTVIGHPNKKLAWVMARSPQIAESTYEKLKKELTSRNYQLLGFRRIPHN
jgi:apolipoprotein D and lipocalin family protein